MIIEAIYKCEVCGTEYKTENECLLCESRHIKVISLEKSEYGKQENYPKTIYLKMKDGTVFRYKLNSIVE